VERATQWLEVRRIRIVLRLVLDGFEVVNGSAKSSVKIVGWTRSGSKVCMRVEEQGITSLS